MFDFHTQTLFGKPVLIWWQGTIAGTVPSKLPPGTPLSGNFVIYNQHYQKIMTIRAPNGAGVDLHELVLTSQGNAYFITTKNVKANLTPYGGPEKGQYETGNPRSEPADRQRDLHLGHGRARPFERFFCPGSHDSRSGVGPLPSQFDRLESRRLATADFLHNTWGIYDISHKTGQVLWQLGGKQNQFRLPSDLITGPYGSAFQYQHDGATCPEGSASSTTVALARRLAAVPTAPRAA